MFIVEGQHQNSDCAGENSMTPQWHLSINISAFSLRFLLDRRTGLKSDISSSISMPYDGTIGRQSRSIFRIIYMLFSRRNFFPGFIGTRLKTKEVLVKPVVIASSDENQSIEDFFREFIADTRDFYSKKTIEAYESRLYGNCKPANWVQAFAAVGVSKRSQINRYTIAKAKAFLKSRM